MLKIRLMGTTNDIKWFSKLLKRDKQVEIIGESEIYDNKGTQKYKRKYVEIQKTCNKGGKFNV